MRISAPIVLCVLASLLFASASSGWDCAPSLGIARPKLTFEDIRSERVQELPVVLGAVGEQNEPQVRTNIEDAPQLFAQLFFQRNRTRTFR